VIRTGWGVLLGAAALLSGCGLLGAKQPDPDGLARWGAARGMFPDDPAKLGFGPADRLRKTADGHGMENVPTKQNPANGTRIYFVPLADLDAKLDADLRARMFPGGTATFAPAEDGQPKRHIALTELDAFYVQLTVAAGNALCEKLTRACDAAHDVSLVGKLKGAPILGNKARAITVNPIVSADGLIGKDIADAQTLCGFDPARDRVPTHVADGCLNQRRIQWAGPHGYTLRPMGLVLPFTEAALKQWLRSYLDLAARMGPGEIGSLTEVK
jgi:hypothetical protein